MNQGKKIASVKQLIDYFQKNQEKIFVIGRIYSNTPLILADFIPGFEMVTCYDPFDGAFPFIKVPDHLKRDHQCTDPFQCQLSILRSPEVIAYLKTNSLNPKIQYMMIDEQNEQISKLNGLQLWCGPCKAFNELGNKINILQMIKKIGGIPYIPNVCSKITSYQHLMKLSQTLNTNKLVVQSQVGCSGMTTYFIFSQQDYDKHASQLENSYVKKIMPFKRVKSFGISAVAGRFGTVIGPLHAEVIGHKKLTPFRGGFCANEMRSDYFQNPQIDKRIRKEIFEITKKLGDYLYKQNIFRGIFGVDFVVDYDTFELYFMEINPRLTGSTTISFQTYQAQGIQFPLALFHFAQYMNLKLDLPIESYNKSWEELSLYQTATHIAIKPFTEKEKNINFTGFPPGLWRKGKNKYEFTGRFTLKLSEMNEDDILFIPNHGFSKGNIIMKKKCQQFSGQLTAETEEIIDFFLGEIQKYKKKS